MSIYIDNITPEIHLVYMSDYRVLKAFKGPKMVSCQRMEDDYTEQDYIKFRETTRRKLNHNSLNTENNDIDSETV